MKMDAFQCPHCEFKGANEFSKKRHVENRHRDLTGPKRSRRLSDLGPSSPEPVVYFKDAELGDLIGCSCISKTRIFKTSETRSKAAMMGLEK